MDTMIGSLHVRKHGNIIIIKSPKCASIINESGGRYGGKIWKEIS